MNRERLSSTRHGPPRENTQDPERWGSAKGTGNFEEWENVLQRRVGRCGRAPRPTTRRKAKMRTKTYRVRRCTSEETRAAARVCAEAFSRKPELRLEALQGLAQAMQAKRRRQVEEDLEYMFARAAARKREATLRAKLERVEGEIAQLKMAVARSGRAHARARIERARWEREAESLRFQRQWICLVAEQCNSGKLIGCVTVSMRQVESLLPPPFPSDAPRRFYLSNMAVDNEFRRQGVARTLLQESERLARRWKVEDMWLHVEEGNDVAEELYVASGFARKRSDPDFFFGRRHLLRKTLDTVD